MGIVGAIQSGVRPGAAIGGLLLLFAGGALRQALVLYAGDLPALEPGVAAAAELGLLLAALGGLAALRALRRTTVERDRVEDLHWDSMEVVRALSELAARPGVELDAKLGSALELGATRFGLEVAVAWRHGEGDGDPGSVIALRAPDRSADADAIVETLLPRLRDAAKSTRPVLLVDAESGLRELFGASLCIDGESRGALAFAGSPVRAHRITATDKDLCALMAQWLSIELERRERRASGESPSETHPVLRVADPGPARPGLPRRNLDLNDVVRSLEPRLRRRVGADATLEVDLAERLPRAGSGRLPLASLVEGLVAAAAELSPAGRIRIETRRVGEADGSGDLTLAVSVAGEEVGAAAFDRLFAEPAEVPAAPAAGDAIPLALLERLLRRDGGDLSVAVEAGRRATLTAYLPAHPRSRFGPLPRGRSYAEGDR